MEAECSTLFFFPFAFGCVLENLDKSHSFVTNVSSKFCLKFWHAKTGTRNRMIGVFSFLISVYKPPQLA